MSPYQKVSIYYFSGTGNSRNVAAWVADVAANMNIETEVFNIGEIWKNKHIEAPGNDNLVVIVSPIHGFNYPPLVVHFLLRFPKGKSKVVLMNTRAGMLIGKFVTPGLTGIAFYFSALVLKWKGYSITGMQPVDLPSNWISLHPGLNTRTVEYLHAKSKPKVEKFTQKVLSGKSSFRAVREIIQDLAIAPVSLLYFFGGRFFIAKTYYASSDCNKCDLCINSCPAKAIIKIDNRPYWTFRCESCMHCMSYCPKKAVETGHGFVLGIILIWIIVLPLFYHYFDLIFFKLESPILQFVAENVVLFIIITLLYRAAHYGMRFKCIERFMVYTSLTKFRFWGRRYKALKYSSKHNNIISL